MNRIEKTVALLLIASMTVSITGCHKKFEKIDEDDIISALEDTLDLEEAEDGDGESDYYNIMDNYPDRDSFIRAYMDSGDGDDGSVVITYIVYEDEDDAEEYFEYCYDVVTDNPIYKPKDYKEHYEEGEWGYAVVEVGDHFLAVYYVDDMVLEVSARSEEDVGYAKDFIRELGLPLK